MTPTFYIAHSSPGRTRIRWAGDASEKSRVTEYAAEIENLAETVTADPRMVTGSIIIEHDALPWSSLQARLTDQLSLTFTATPEAGKRSGTEALNKNIDDLDGALKHLNMDFDSLTLLILSVLAIIQAARGQVMSSSVSFLWYAFNLLMMARNRTDRISQDIPETTE
jgi:hypothetical protein